MKVLSRILVAVAIVGAGAGGSSAAEQAEIDARLERFYELAKAGKNEEAARMLREDGFPSSVDKDGHTPLIVAVATGNEDLLLEVLKYPHDLAHQDAKGCTAVWFAAARGHNSILERLLELGGPPTTSKENAVTPLMVAVIAGNHDAIPLLVAAGAPVDEGEDGGTALLFAVLRNDPVSVRTLLEHGADPSRRYKSTTLVEKARKKGYTEVERLLLGQPSPEP